MDVVTRAETDELTPPYLGSDFSTVNAAQQVYTSAARELSSLYISSSPRLAVRLAQIRHAISAASQTSITLQAAGIRNVAFQTVAITGTTATVHLTFTAYSDVVLHPAPGQTAHATPSNDMIGKVVLNKTDQGWRIIDEITRFAPGSEP